MDQSRLVGSRTLQRGRPSHDQSGEGRVQGAHGQCPGTTIVCRSTTAARTFNSQPPCAHGTKYQDSIEEQPVLGAMHCENRQISPPRHGGRHSNSWMDWRSWRGPVATSPRMAAMALPQLERQIRAMNALAPRPALMVSVWRSRIIGSETTLTAKINPAKTLPNPSHEGARRRAMVRLVRRRSLDRAFAPDATA